MGTSKGSASVVCRHYRTSRGCYNGDNCPFIHTNEPVPSPPRASQIKISCRYFEAGYCHRGEQCWYQHVKTPAPQQPSSGPSTSVSKNEETSDSPESTIEPHTCIICFEENPSTYGLLGGCSHSFCLECIRNWRDPAQKDLSVVISGVIKTCPACREPSRFITPSNQFFPEGHPMKAARVEGYKNSMARISCKYFARSKIGKRFCPFGKDCFYKHENPDGSAHIFEHGAEEMMARQQSRARSRRTANLLAINDLAQTINAFADELMNMHLSEGNAYGDELDASLYGADEEEEEEELDDFGEDIGEEWDDEEDEVDFELDELWMAEGISAFLSMAHSTLDDA